MGGSSYNKSAKEKGFSAASICPFCGKGEEEHILIHYPPIWEQ